MLGLTIPLMLLARWSHEVVLLGGVTVIVKTRLRGWAYRIRTGESVRELSDWNFVTTSPEVVQARRRRPFALELRCTNLQLRRIFSSLAGYYGDYSLAALGIQLDEIQHQRLLARV